MKHILKFNEHSSFTQEEFNIGDLTTLGYIKDIYVDKKTGQKTYNIDGVWYHQKFVEKEIQSDETSNLTEELNIKEKALSSNTFLKAPNGKETNLTEKQWLQVRTNNFKKWFGDWENDSQNASKIIDDNGEPMIVYRGTPEKLGNIFQHGKKYYGGNKGFWFTGVKSVAKTYAFDSITGDTGEIKEVYLNIKNPIDLTQLGVRTTSKNFITYINEITDIYLGRGTNKEYLTIDLYSKYQNELYNGSHDGIILIDNAYTAFIAKGQYQIKSATNNNGDFDPNNENITK